MHGGRAAGTPDLTHALPEGVRQAFASGPAIYAYVDVARLRPFLREVVPGSEAKAADDLASQVRAVSFDLDAVNGMVSANLTAFAPAGGFAGGADAGAL